MSLGTLFNPKGLSLRTNSRGIPILRLHYSAIPDRDAKWVASERKKYSRAMWEQEQEIDYGAAGGERVLRDLLVERWDEIVITDPEWEADPAWAFGAGMDYGKSHPTSWGLNAVDFEGCRYALCEHHQSGNDWTPERHTKAIRDLRVACLRGRPLALSVARGTICDPSMGFQNVAQEDKFTSIIDLFAGAGFPNLHPGIRGGDLAMVDQIREAWSGPKVRFKILCRVPFAIDHNSLKKREGTYPDGCPNLLWELWNLKRKENSAARQETVGPAEGLVDKDNDAFDRLKYWWNAQKSVPEHTAEEKWTEKLGQLKKERPQITLNGLIRERQKWEVERSKEEIVSYI